MEWLREWSWRIALLALPWQTRWFQEGPMLGGLPWEQGRWVFYISWIPLLFTLFMACREPFKPMENSLPPRAWVGLAGVLFFGLSVCVSVDPIVSIRWLLQITILVFFGWSLLQLNVSRTHFLTWCVISIVPEAVLGIGQFLGQEVIGSKWLGISSQIPATLGVSVIEVGTRRILRAYGGLPHPNILGGWLAFGLVAITQFYKRAWVYVVASLFSVALILTFSRSAWIAAVLGIVISFFVLWKAAWTMDDKLHVVKLGAVIFVSAGLVGISVYDIVTTRVSRNARLEQQSNNERIIAIRNTWSLVHDHPVLGTGPNTAIKVLDQAGLGIVPAHLTFLLIVLETGILGGIGFILLLFFWIRLRGIRAIAPLFFLLPLALFDHYLWSLWAGQGLLMMVLVSSLTKDEKSAKHVEA